MAGATTIARGTWNGSALVDVKDIWHDPAAIRTESSRIGFARDGMLHMTVSASGTGADVMRSADPNDHAGKTIRLRDDGSVPPDNPFVNKPGYKPAIYTLGHRNGHSMQLNPETGEFWVTEQGPNAAMRSTAEACSSYAGQVKPWRNLLGPKIRKYMKTARATNGRLGAIDCCRRGTFYMVQSRLATNSRGRSSEGESAHGKISASRSNENGKKSP